MFPILVLTLSVLGFETQQQAPTSADEVTLRHRIYADERVTIFLLDIPPGQATLLHRHKSQTSSCGAAAEPCPRGTPV